MRSAFLVFTAGALLLDTGSAGRAASTAGAARSRTDEAPSDDEDSDWVRPPSLRRERHGKAAGTVVVLTMNRPKSLEKLLDSLCSADFGGETVDLRVEVDALKDNATFGGGPHGPTVELLKEFNWPFGQKMLNFREKNVGLARSWIDFAWPDPEQDSGLHVILEDDVTVSPVFWTWLRKDMSLAASRSDVAGLSLQRPTMNASDGKQLDRIGPLNAPFLYQLVGSIGFAPRAEVWRDFLAWHDGMLLQHEDPTQGNVAALVTSGWYRTLNKHGRSRSMWSQWFIKFSADRGLYTLYQNPLHGALASHGREPGEHSGGGGADFPACTSADVAIDDFNFADIPKYDFSVRDVGEAFWRGWGERTYSPRPADAGGDPLDALDELDLDPVDPDEGFLQVDSEENAGVMRATTVRSASNFAMLKVNGTSWEPTAQSQNGSIGGIEDPRLQQYLGPQAAQDVSSALQRLRKSASRAVVASFTVEMREMAENFLCSAAASKEPSTGILMVGLYEGACQNFHTHGAESLAIVPKGTPTGNSTKDVVYKSQKYLHSVLVKHVVFTLAVSSAYFEWLLLSDVDVMLLAPSFAYVDQQGMVGDFAFMRGNAAPDSVSKLNSGFYYVRSTPQSRQIMWKSLDNLFNGQTYDGGDQGALTKAITDAGVVPNYLPSSLYPNGAILVRHPQSLAPAPRAFHLNYIKTMSEKIRCMKEAHCWSLKPDGTCSAECSAQQVRSFRCHLEGAFFLEESDDAIFF
jgi:hypothetical protein